MTRIEKFLAGVKAAAEVYQQEKTTENKEKLFVAAFNFSSKSWKKIRDAYVALMYSKTPNIVVGIFEKGETKTIEVSIDGEFRYWYWGVR